MGRPVPDDLKLEAERIAGKYLRFDISCQRLYEDVSQALVAERERAAFQVDLAAEELAGNPKANPALAIAEALLMRVVAQKIRQGA